MNRNDKEILVESLRSSFANSQASFLVMYKGLTVNQMQNLRKGLRPNEASLQVAKARLMKRAVNGVEGVDQLADHLHDQIGAVFATKSAPEVAKFLAGFAKENEAFKVLVGVIESKLYDAQSIQRIASLPSREVLLAQLCGTLNAPLTNMVTVLHLMIARLLFVLKQIEEQKQAGSAPEVEQAESAPEVVSDAPVGDGTSGEQV